MSSCSQIIEFFEGKKKLFHIELNARILAHGPSDMEK